MSAVQGNRASGSSDRGAPVKTGGKYNATQPTFADGDRADLQADSKGNLRVTVQDTGGIPAAITSLGDGVSAGNRGLLVAAQEYLFNGTTVDKARTPTTFKVVAAVAVSAGTGVTVWTPTAGKKFRLMGYKLSSTANASLIFGDNAVGTVIFRSPLLAAAGVDTAGAGDIGNGILSAAINNVLKLDASATTVVTGTVWGTEE